MADYIITLPDGSQFTIQSGTIDNQYDIPLVGQDAINYGDDFATAFMRLLVNFADNTAPSFGSQRLAGQLWYDTTPITGGLRVYDGGTWDNIALESGIVTIDGNQTINDTKTFSDAPAFTASGEPFTVNSTTQVSNLNASLLEGNASTAFATAAQGLKADAAEVNIGNPPVDGYIYSSTSAGTRSWIAPTAGTGNVDPIDIGSMPGGGSPTTMSVLLVDNPTGSQDPVTDAGLTFNGSTNTLTTSTFVGNLTGTATNADNATLAATATTATTVTLTNEASDTTTFVTFANTATGDQQMHTNAGLAFNSSTATLTATNLAGNGSNITALNANNVTSGTLAVGRGGTGVTTATGTGSSFVLHTSPTFVTSIVVPLINNSSGVAIQYNGTTNFGTQAYNGTDITSGAYVRDGLNTLRDVGFNQMITTDVSTSQNFTQAQVGHSWRATNSSGTVTFTTLGAGDTSIPNGAMWIVRNKSTSTGVVQINSGAGDTLALFDGSGSIKNSIGGANVYTLARGGVATVVKVSDTLYEMWGIGISGGA